MKDDELVLLAQNGDVGAVGMIYDKYSDSIYRYCLWKTNRNIGDSEDLVQDIFMEMARSIKNYRHEASLKNWLYGITRNKLMGWMKQKYKLVQEPIFDDLADIPDMIDPAGQDECIRSVERLLASLGEQERKVIELRYLRNMSVRDTAQDLGLTESNVKVITHRALKKLRECQENVTLSTLNR